MIVPIQDPKHESKKHERDDDPTDDEQDVPIKRSRSESTETTMSSKVITPKAGSPTHTPPPNKSYRVVLIMRTGETTQSEVHLREDVVRKVALYNNKLNNEIKINPNTSTLTIRDPIIRPQNAIRDLFQFLEEGTVDPADYTTSLALKKSWNRLFTLWQLGELLGAQDLEQVIIDHLDLRKIAPGLLVDILRRWFAIEAEVQLRPQLKLPREMRVVLKERIDELVENGFDNAIIPDGSLYLAVFTAVLAEKHRALLKEVSSE